MPSEDAKIDDLPLIGGHEDEAGASQGAEQPAAAGSSPATDVNQPEDTALSVVRDVVDARKAEPPAASSATGEDAGAKPGDQPSAKQDDENYSDVPFNKHPRFQALLRERNDNRTDAERYRNVDRFLTEHGMSAEEAADVLVVGAMAKTNPAEAWKMARPWVEKLLIASGELLPDDLRKRVEAGELSPAAAQDLSRAHAQVQSVQSQRSFEQQRAQDREQRELTQSIVSAADAWETDRQAKDPNFAAKTELLHKEIVFLQSREGKPRTPAGVTDQLQRAYDAANKVFVPPAPAGMVQVAPHARRPAVRPVTGGQVAGNARPEAQSTLDIVRANRRGAR